MNVRNRQGRHQSCTEAGSLDYENHDIVLVLNYKPDRRKHVPICVVPNSFSSCQWQIWR